MASGGTRHPKNSTQVPDGETSTPPTLPTFLSDPSHVPSVKTIQDVKQERVIVRGALEELCLEEISGRATLRYSIRWLFCASMQVGPGFALLC